MKTALYLTNCTADASQILHRWSSTDEPVRLTVVYPYTIETGRALTKDSFHQAKNQAETRLQGWANQLPQAWPGEVRTETLLAEPELAATLHLLLRGYDYMLVDDEQLGLSEAASALLTQTQTQLCQLCGKPTYAAV
ncbi:hypothetical protein F5984_11910 [Rudanella paleaurantiibacter]|uniref:Universal stress protein n=1 Tax=Rudanella paleaurantiibacter TaxID=2614655 RepID=A0A7J5TZK2_9BACT|nr:hypothetical protein [Rudanella paleaurantiibacter]KAB7730844.1 hypothetical protein F5984_11910 [Rudanella paleaurantiibacter]